jgi:hypothetical protein
MGRYDPKTPSSFNALSILMTLVVGGAVYAAFTFAPHYYPLLQIRALIGEAANSGYRQHKDDVIYKSLVGKAEKLNIGLERNDFLIERERYGHGELTDFPYSQRKVYQKRGKSITVSFEKYVDVKWLFIDKWTEIKLSASRTVELSQVTW